MKRTDLDLGGYPGRKSKRKLAGSPHAFPCVNKRFLGNCKLQNYVQPRKVGSTKCSLAYQGIYAACLEKRVNLYPGLSELTTKNLKGPRVPRVTGRGSPRETGLYC